MEDQALASIHLPPQQPSTQSICKILVGATLCGLGHNLVEIQFLEMPQPVQDMAVISKAMPQDRRCLLSHKHHCQAIGHMVRFVFLTDGCVLQTALIGINLTELNLHKDNYAKLQRIKHFWC